MIHESHVEGRDSAEDRGPVLPDHRVDNPRVGPWHEHGRETTVNALVHDIGIPGDMEKRQYREHPFLRILQIEQPRLELLNRDAGVGVAQHDCLGHAGSAPSVHKCCQIIEAYLGLRRFGRSAF